MFSRKKLMLEFAMTVICSNGRTYSKYEYTTRAESATKAIESLFITIAGEKVVCIGSTRQGESVMFPKSVLFSVECKFVRECPESELES